MSTKAPIVRVLRQADFTQEDIIQAGHVVTQISLAAGEIYEGEVVDGKFEGIGILSKPIQPNLSKIPGAPPPPIEYFGQFQKNLRQGIGIGGYESSVQYTGQWDRDQWHGYGSLMYPDGSIFKGMFDRGQRGEYGELITAKGVSYLGKHGRREFKLGICSKQTGGFGWVKRESKSHDWQTNAQENVQVTSQEGEFSISSRGSLCLKGRGILRFGDGGSASGLFVDGELVERLPAAGFEGGIQRAVTQANLVIAEVNAATRHAVYVKEEALFLTRCFAEPYLVPCGFHECSRVDAVSRRGLKPSKPSPSAGPDHQTDQATQRKFGVCGG